MYVESVPNRNSPPATLLRESFRDGGQVRKRTLANISDWPPAQVESLRRVLKGETFPTDGDSLNIIRSLPHGHVAAVVGTIRKLGLPQLLRCNALAGSGLECRHDCIPDFGSPIQIGYSSRTGSRDGDQQSCRNAADGIGPSG